MAHRALAPAAAPVLRIVGVPPGTPTMGPDQRVMVGEDGSLAYERLYTSLGPTGEPRMWTYGGTWAPVHATGRLR